MNARIAWSAPASSDELVTNSASDGIASIASRAFAETAPVQVVALTATCGANIRHAIVRSLTRSRTRQSTGYIAIAGMSERQERHAEPGGLLTLGESVHGAGDDMPAVSAEALTPPRGEDPRGIGGRRARGRLRIGEQHPRHRPPRQE